MAMEAASTTARAAAQYRQEVRRPLSPHPTLHPVFKMRQFSLQRFPSNFLIALPSRCECTLPELSGVF
jgi:hypothetical protein